MVTIYHSVSSDFRIERNSYGQVRVIAVSSNSRSLIYYFEDQKRIWAVRYLPHVMTEKSSFRISRYINFFKPDEYEIIRRYSVIKFLLTREIVGHHWLPKELLAKIVDISD
jgi:hypothetical protein